MIGEFRSASRVSVFQGSLLVIVIMIDGSENAVVKAAFELLKSSHVCKSVVSLKISFPLSLSTLWRNSKILPKYFLNWLIKI